MNYLMGRLPFLLEIVINGFFVLLYTFKKSKQVPELLGKLPLELIFQYAIWVVPVVLFISLIANFLKSEGFEDFIRRFIFSLIIFVPVLITWGDIEFVYWFFNISCTMF